MDFKIKYLKYKQKYLSMKKMIGGSETILVPLKLGGGNDIQTKINNLQKHIKTLEKAIKKLNDKLEKEEQTEQKKTLEQKLERFENILNERKKRLENILNERKKRLEVLQIITKLKNNEELSESELETIKKFLTSNKYNEFIDKNKSKEDKISLLNENIN